MALELPDKWIWDSWYADDGQLFHAFYLQASRALGDPERRHWYPSIGHAVSDDLRNWTVVRDALAVSDPPAHDDATTWTGSVTRDDDGGWWLFYTGTSFVEDRWIQRILAARSSDLMVWEKVPGFVVESDPAYYGVVDRPRYPHHDWRDPWVFRFPGDPQWHMLITAGADTSNLRQRGVIGHATSNDLVNWKVGPALTQPESGFGNLEVPQFAIVDGVPLLVFCCGANELAEQRSGEAGGVYSLPVAPELAAVDITRSRMFPMPGLYAARLVQDRSGGWNLMGFMDRVDGEFVGRLTDPIPVTADPELGLVPKETPDRAGA
jgi:beta-fructofuranosidase